MGPREIEIVPHSGVKRWIARVVGEDGAGASATGRTPEAAAKALRTRVYDSVAVLDTILGTSAIRTVQLNRFEELLRRALRRAFEVALAGRPLRLYWVTTDEDADSGWIVARSRSEAELHFEDAAGLQSGIARAWYNRPVHGPAEVGQPSTAVLRACGLEDSRATTDFDELADLAPELRRLVVRSSLDSRQPS